MRVIQSVMLWIYSNKMIIVREKFRTFALKTLITNLIIDK